MELQVLGIIAGLFLVVAGGLGALISIPMAVDFLNKSEGTDVLIIAVIMSMFTMFCIWYGIKLFVSSKRTYREKVEERKTRPSSEVLKQQPWLSRVPWRKREIIFNAPVGDTVLVLAFIFFTPIVAFCLWFAFTTRQAIDGGSIPLLPRIPVLAFGVPYALALVYITYARLRRARYGNSICRLLDLPAQLGGALNADVECLLPAGVDDYVNVRKNRSRRRSGAF